MVSSKVTEEEIINEFKDYFRPDNSLVVNIDKSLKSFYSSVAHASLFWSKYFQDSLCVFLAKIILGEGDKLTLAKEHVYLMHQ